MPDFLKSSSGSWRVLRGPLTVATVLSCAVSVLTRGYLAPSLVASGIVAWSFVPLSEIAGIAAMWRMSNVRIPLAQTIDVFFASHRAWLLWVVAFTAFWTQVFGVISPKIFWIWTVSAIPVALWSAREDLLALRRMSARNTGMCLLAQRAVSWSLFLVIFGGGSLWSGFLGIVR